VIAVVLAAAGCSGGAHPGTGATPAGTSPAGTSPAAAASPAGSAVAGPAASAAAPARLPGCGTATASAPALRTVPTRLEPVPGTPFGVVVTADGRWSFVALAGPVGVFRLGGSAGPALVGQVATGQTALGEALTPDGRYLLAADNGSGASVISVSRAENGQAPALVGQLNSPGGSGAIEVAVPPDGRLAFVSLEDSGTIAVYNLRQALASNLRSSYFLGTIKVGLAPVGLAFSPDGRWLYATSEAAAVPSGGATPGEGAQGTLTVISVSRAATDPAASVVSTVTAGCSPVRVVTSADGSVVWVTARGSDSLLAFSAALLRTDPARSLLASVRVGEAPVGLALVDGGKRIVVADSDRFGAPGAVSGLAVVSVPAALAGRPALLGYLPAGGFPREMALTPDGRELLVSNYSSSQLESVDLAGLP
jgi:DNA-binding beta-propeller fold protein YncE